MSYSDLVYECADGVGLIRFNRPHVLNAMSPDMLSHLAEALDRAALDEAVRVIVLTGEGRAFCTGADLKASTSEGTPLDIGKLLVKYYNPVIMRIHDLEKPVICAVNGMAVGAGANLAFICDLCIAARSASFTQIFTQIGLIPDMGGTWSLPRLVGRQVALGLSLLGDKISAEEARQWGLIWQVVEDEELLATAMALAKRLVAGPTRAYASTKKAINASFGNSLREQLILESELQSHCGFTEDFSEALKAFGEKRKAEFTGR